MKPTTMRLVVIAVVAALVLGAAATLFGALTSGDEDTGSSPPPTVAPSTGPVDPSVTEAPTPALADYYAQELAWERCGIYECAELTVPVDYGDPTGETIQVAVNRVPATDQQGKVGTMVVNPGGPGAPGTDYAERSGSVFRAPLTDVFDIVGFDPRGTGDSSPVDCLSDDDLDAFLAYDPAPDDPGEAEEFEALVGDFFAGCVDNTGPLIGHVTTVETARDMDVLRSALREETLTYFGASYGTKLGATYAELFPDRVGRFVLDGAVDVSLSVARAHARPGRWVRGARCRRTSRTASSPATASSATRSTRGSPRSRACSSRSTTSRWRPGPTAN